MQKTCKLAWCYCQAINTTSMKAVDRPGWWLMPQIVSVAAAFIGLWDTRAPSGNWQTAWGIGTCLGHWDTILFFPRCVWEGQPHLGFSSLAHVVPRNQNSPASQYMLLCPYPSNHTSRGCIPLPHVRMLGDCLTWKSVTSSMSFPFKIKMVTNA